MHWTQTPEGRRKLSKMRQARWGKKKESTAKYAVPRADLTTVLNSAWNNLSTHDKIKALAYLTKEEE